MAFSGIPVTWREAQRRRLARGRTRQQERKMQRCGAAGRRLLPGRAGRDGGGGSAPDGPPGCECIEAPGAAAPAIAPPRAGPTTAGARAAAPPPPRAGACASIQIGVQVPRRAFGARGGMAGATVRAWDACVGIQMGGRVAPCVFNVCTNKSAKELPFHGGRHEIHATPCAGRRCCCAGHSAISAYLPLCCTVCKRLHLLTFWKENAQQSVRARTAVPQGAAAPAAMALGGNYYKDEDQRFALQEAPPSLPVCAEAFLGGHRRGGGGRDAA